MSEAAEPFGVEVISLVENRRRLGGRGSVGALVPAWARFCGASADVASGHEPVVMLNATEDRECDEAAGHRWWLL